MNLSLKKTTMTDARIEQSAVALAARVPEDALRWADDQFGDRVALATGFGAEGCVLVAMLARINPGARFFYLDTGFLFPETERLRVRLESLFGITFERRAAPVPPDDDLRLHDPRECCRRRKVEPLREMLGGLDAWITAIRRDQSPTRANTRIVERDARFGLVKINPLAYWTRRDVWRYLLRHDIPYNPLHDAGYASIGCRPCTTPVRAGEDERAGRWRGTSQTECGLHVPQS